MQISADPSLRGSAPRSLVFKSGSIGLQAWRWVSRLGMCSWVSRLGMCSCGPKEFFLDSKGNVQDFLDRVLAVFGSCLDGVQDFFASRAPRPELFEAFGLVSCVRGWFRDSFAACLAVRGFRACVLVFEAFGSGGPRPDFARPKRLFLWSPKVTWNSFLARVLAVFGSCPDGVWDFSHLSVKARFREAQKSVFVDSKGNVKQFFGSGFRRFRVVS